jgi:hypothetical protein
MLLRTVSHVRKVTIVSVVQCGRDRRAATRRRVRVEALDAGVVVAPVAPQ